MSTHDCVGLGSDGVGKGCYYDDQWSSYSSCHAICDGVTSGSVEEEECNAKCPGSQEIYHIWASW